MSFQMNDGTYALPATLGFAITTFAIKDDARSPGWRAGRRIIGTTRKEYSTQANIMTADGTFGNIALILIDLLIYLELQSTVSILRICINNPSWNVVWNLNFRKRILKWAFRRNTESVIVHSSLLNSSHMLEKLSNAAWRRDSCRYQSGNQLQHRLYWKWIWNHPVTGKAVGLKISEGVA